MNRAGQVKIVGASSICLQVAHRTDLFLTLIHDRGSLWGTSEIANQ